MGKYRAMPCPHLLPPTPLFTSRSGIQAKSTDSSIMAEEILLEKRGKIAIITFNREKKLNALNSDLYFQLASMMHQVAAMPDIFITVLTGKGRFFSRQGGIRPCGS